MRGFNDDACRRVWRLLPYYWALTTRAQRRLPLDRYRFYYGVRGLSLPKLARISPPESRAGPIRRRRLIIVHSGFAAIISRRFITISYYFRRSLFLFMTSLMLRRQISRRLTLCAQCVLIIACEVIASHDYHSSFIAMRAGARLHIVWAATRYLHCRHRDISFSTRMTIMKADYIMLFIWGHDMRHATILSYHIYYSAGRLWNYYVWWRALYYPHQRYSRQYTGGEYHFSRRAIEFIVCNALCNSDESHMHTYQLQCAGHDI